MLVRKNDHLHFNCCKCSPSFEDISVFMTVVILAAIFLVEFGSLDGAFGYGLCKKVQQFEMKD